MQSHLATVAGLLISSVAAAEVIHVPSMAPTIQIAIDTSIPGDRIVVAPGTYTENIRFYGTAIEVSSSHGPHVTTIDANFQSSGVVFADGEGRDSILRGFRIINGIGNSDVFWNRGGGIYVSNESSPTIAGNIIEDNHVTTDGGGIYVSNGSAPAIFDNIIRQNSTDWYNGGGIGCWNSSPRIENNIIIGNYSGSGGGGIFCQGCPEAYITGNTIADNQSTDDGAGIKLDGPTHAEIHDNFLDSNRSGDHGGAIYVSGGAPALLTGNRIFNNRSDGEGGGVMVTGGTSVTFSGNTCDNNVCFGNGGTIHITGTPEVTANDNHITGSYAPGAGGGISVAHAASAILRRNVLQDNYGHRGAGVHFSAVQVSIVASNIFEGNYADGGSPPVGGLGGGMRIDGGTCQFVNNRFTENRTLDLGGGAWLSLESASIVAGNLFSGNRCRWHGGGLYLNNLVPTTHNTFIGNHAGETGGGMRCADNTPIDNSIFYGNMALSGTAWHCQSSNGSPVVRATQVDIYPAFITPLGADGFLGTLDDDYRLASCSEARDAGAAEYLPADTADVDEDGDFTEPLPVDAAGAPRVIGVPDMGAFESQPGTPCPELADCDGNGILDVIDIADCDGSAWCLDCNGNGRPDTCDLEPTDPSYDAGTLYWRFEDDDARDSGRFGLDGLINGAGFSSDVPVATIPRSGMPNERVCETGDTGRVRFLDVDNLAGNASDDPSDFTLEAWVRIDELSGMGAGLGPRQTLAQRKEPGDPDRRGDYLIMAQGGALPTTVERKFGKLSGYTGRELVLAFGLGDELWAATSFLTIDDNDWHFVAISFDASERSARFVLDRQVEVIDMGDNQGRPLSFGHLVLGAHRAADGQYNQFLNGAFDEVRFSRKVVPVSDLLNALPPGAGGDCNGNGVPDDCDVASGASADLDGDGLPDECNCPGDITGDSTVDFNDLVTLLAQWGAPYDFDDLLELLGAWGPC